jgi:methylase of polypeptide subunit release factors
MIERTLLVEEVEFDGLAIRFDARVLRPRGWTVLQSAWAHQLLEDLPPGPVLELCCGAGQIGLAAVRRNRRRLVSVDQDPVAATYAGENARAAGLATRVEVRTGDLTRAVHPGELFALVLADPPWVPESEVGRFPEDPMTAIDGGPDGLRVARNCVQVAAAHLLPGGAILLQLGTVAQVAHLAPALAELGLRCADVRVGERGLVARLSAAG